MILEGGKQLGSICGSFSQCMPCNFHVLSESTAMPWTATMLYLYIFSWMVDRGGSNRTYSTSTSWEDSKTVVRLGMEVGSAMARTSLRQIPASLTLALGRMLEWSIVSSQKDEWIVGGQCRLSGHVTMVERIMRVRRGRCANFAGVYLSLRGVSTGQYISHSLAGFGA